jgi:hypothetical protein
VYLMGAGHEHMGPGTSMVQRIDWTQANETQLGGLGCVGLGCVGLVPEFAADGRQMTRYRGMGCGCKGLGCGGLGLFESGIDFSGWGPVEWTLVALGGYMALSTLFTTQRGAERVRKSFRRYARRKAVPA